MKLLLNFILLLNLFALRAQPIDVSNYQYTTKCAISIDYSFHEATWACHCDTTNFILQCPGLAEEDLPVEVNWYMNRTEPINLYYPLGEGGFNVDTFYCKPAESYICETIFALLVFNDGNQGFDTSIVNICFEYDYCTIDTLWVVPTKTTLCQGDTLSLFGFAQNVPELWYWTLPGSEGYSYSTQNLTHIKYDSIGTFDVTLIAISTPYEFGFWSFSNPPYPSDTLVLKDYITVLPRLEGLFLDTVQTYMVSVGDTLDLSACVTADSFVWEPSVGLSCYDCPTPQLFVDSIAFYTCIASNEGYCDSKCLTYLNFTNEDKIFVPTAFSPNADGQNDSFEVFGDRITIKEMLIYDQWGNAIYKYDALNNNWWDGTFRNQPCAPGVYSWLIVFFNERTKLTKTISESVTLFR